MFYFDKNIEAYEAECSWDKVLAYLEEMFIHEQKISIINSLVGYAWYYLIKGPIDSGKYENDENHCALEVWSKYLKIGINRFSNDLSFMFNT